MGYRDEVVALLPVLRRVAGSLTRDPMQREDLVQETMMKGLQQESHFDGNNLKAYLCTILRNDFIKAVRRAKYRATLDIDDEDIVLPGISGSQEATIILKETLAAIDRLSPKMREVIALATEGYQMPQIAARLHIPLGTVKSRLSRARAAL